MEQIFSWIHSPLGAIGSVFLFGLLLVIFGILWERKIKKKNLFQTTEKEETLIRHYTGILDRISWIRKEEEHLNKTLAILQVNYTARDITDIKIFGLVIAGMISFFLKNFLLFIPLAVLAWQIPKMVVERRIAKRLNLFDSQFLDALKAFLTEYATLQNAQQAFVKMLPKTENPIRQEFEYIARRLNSGEPPRRVMEDFAERTQNPWTMLFARLIIFHFEEGANIENQILALMDKLSTDKIIRDKNRTEVSAVRNVNLVLNAAVPLVFLSNYVLNPQAVQVFTDTPSGKAVLAVAALLSLVSLYLGKKLEQM